MFTYFNIVRFFRADVLKEWFERASAQQFSGIDVSYEQRIESGHHRREIRQVWSVPITVIGELYQPRLWAD